MSAMARSSFKNSIPPEHAAALIRAHDGDVALLYIWESANEGRDYEKAARDLCMTIGSVEAGFEKLDRLGLFTSVSPSPAGNVSGAENVRFVPGAEELPNYTAEDIKGRTEEPEFKAIVDESMTVLGRGLSSGELVKLFGIYDHLGLSAEVIFELVHFCADITLEKYGPSKKVSFRMIEKEAFYWANNGITDLDSAEAYISRRKKLSEFSEKIKMRIGISGRELTEGERKYISGWAELGFDEDCIYEAYNRTVMNTGGLKWPYMDKIIRTWGEKGFKSLDDITKNDGTAGKAAGAKSSRSAKTSSGPDFEAARRWLDSIKNEE